MGGVVSSPEGTNGNWFSDGKPSFDPQAGFNYKREERVVVATEEELISARIPPKYRDFCSHYLLEYHKCRHQHVPLFYKCAHERHAYLNCEQQDYVLRMKEFERERRLRIREERVASAA